MRYIERDLIVETVERLCIEACYSIDDDVLEALERSRENEKSPIGQSILSQIIDNDLIARRDSVPMCQDTGVVIVFLEIGTDCHIDYDIYEAINEGVRNGYKNGYLRKSVVRHPLDRVNTNDNTPAVIHTKLISGDKINLLIAPKGAGSENMSLVKMLTPADGYEGVKKLVLDTVFDAKGKPCPPIIVGVGIGGTFEKAALLAKEAVMRPINDSSPDEIARKLEFELLRDINKLGIGPLGFGGTQTALAVKVNVYPCHIASLPVAVNIQCHASRHKKAII